MCVRAVMRGGYNSPSILSMKSQASEAPELRWDHVSENVATMENR
jgi:hypothetical protein